MSKDTKTVSIIIPCINEEENVGRTLEELVDVMKDCPHDYEVIVVNDGSIDGTWEVVERFAREHPQISGLDLMTNFGQSAAYQAGFDASRGDYVITLSADLEMPIDSVRRVIDHLDQGYDFVNTHRVGRWSEARNRGVKSSMANRLIRMVSGVDVKDRGSGTKGMTRALVRNLRLYGEMHRFIPDYVSQYGARMIEIDVEFRDREAGESYYRKHHRTLKVALDLFTLAFMLYFARRPFSFMPGRLFGFTGVVIGLLGFVATAYLLVLKIMGQAISGRPLLIAAAIALIIGVQFVMMGMLGELMLRIYFESSQRRTYAVRNITAAPQRARRAKAATSDESRAKVAGSTSDEPRAKAGPQD